MPNSKFGSDCGEISGMHLGQKGHGDASTKELAEMLGGELANGFDDVRLDSVGGFFRVIGVDIDGL